MALAACRDVLNEGLVPADAARQLERFAGVYQSDYRGVDTGRRN